MVEVSGRMNVIYTLRKKVSIDTDLPKVTYIYKTVFVCFVRWDHM